MSAMKRIEPLTPKKKFSIEEAKAVADATPNITDAPIVQTTEPAPLVPKVKPKPTDQIEDVNAAVSEFLGVKKPPPSPQALERPTLEMAHPMVTDARITHAKPTGIKGKVTAKVSTAVTTTGITDDLKDVLKIPLVKISAIVIAVIVFIMFVVLNFL